VPEADALELLEKKLCYEFTDRGLLMEALTHKSFHFENKGKSGGFNERLEFLGDSVLGLAVAGELFSMPGVLDESVMSMIKSYVVSGEVISEVALGLGLGDFLLLGKGEDDSGGRQKRSVLANAMEAVIGAVYADAGYKEARSLVLRLFGRKIEGAMESDIYKDFKSELQEVSQEIFSELPEYRVAEEEGPEHEKTFSVEVLIRGKLYGSGKGTNKKEAQQAAAREALEGLDT
jgi:ribonuclease-3